MQSFVARFQDALPDAPSPSHTPKPFVCVADDLLAHMAFLSDAYTAEGCTFEEARAYLFEVDGVDKLLVRVDPALQLAYTAPFDDVPEELRPETPDCTIRCPPAELLTMLAGGAAGLQTSSVPALQDFLRCFDFSAYPAFCAARHMVAWVPPSNGGGGGGGEVGQRVRRSIGALGDKVGALGDKVGERVSGATSKLAAVSQRLRGKPPTHRAGGGAVDAGVLPACTVCDRL